MYNLKMNATFFLCSCVREQTLLVNKDYEYTSLEMHDNVGHSLAILFNLSITIG